MWKERARNVPSGTARCSLESSLHRFWSYVIQTNLRSNLSTQRSYPITPPSLRVFVFTLILYSSAFGQQSAPHTYHVDCGTTKAGGDGSAASPLSSLREVDSLELRAGDRVLFRRGSECRGVLQPNGSGRKGEPIRIGAYGAGKLPRIQVSATDEAAVKLFNQEYWEISSLEIQGGTQYGIFIGGDAGTMHHILLRDLVVHDVRGTLKRKESGLVVIAPKGKSAAFDDVELDGIQAWNTSQWAGIVISGLSLETPIAHVRVSNSIVHDVQGDGIVLFNVKDGVISRSVAWHTGMQHAESIGTPNAIWTWHCVDCLVEQNEAFLADSPGVDGGAFDIDYGNTRNTVRENFGHDTQGYCVSVFGAEGTTISSAVADNLCLNNGMSPRLAQRQGAILIMTWKQGSIDGVEVRGNQIEWLPGGEAAAIQAGADLQAKGVRVVDNHIWSVGTTFVDPGFKYIGEKNRYVLAGNDNRSLAEAKQKFTALGETGSTLEALPATGAQTGALDMLVTRTEGWKLIATVPSSRMIAGKDAELRGLLVELKSAALQFGPSGLQVIVESDGDLRELDSDWKLSSDGIQLQQRPVKTKECSLALISPAGNPFRTWTGYAGPVTIGLALRQTVGKPTFGLLKFEQIKATD
jgi:Right handed beta helix region